MQYKSYTRCIELSAITNFFSRSEIYFAKLLDSVKKNTFRKILSLDTVYVLDTIVT